MQRDSLALCIVGVMEQALDMKLNRIPTGSIALIES